ncbi:hypothetical protein SFK218_1566 [Shigella flexneri K-218]|nr:hypothetical protein SFK218_1566 [Shigella flexneri K-218]
MVMSLYRSQKNQQIHCIQDHDPDLEGNTPSIPGVLTE